MPTLKTKSPGYDLESAFEWLRGRARSTRRLHPRAAASLTSDASKVGGDFLWPVDQPWPHCLEHGSDYVPVLQLRSDDVPELVFPPGADLLQVVWCPNDHVQCGCCPELSVFWRSAAGLKHLDSAILNVKARRSDYVPRLCQLNPETVVEYPGGWELTETDWEELKEWRDNGCELYQYSLSVAPGFKVGGYPHWVQEPEWPECSCGKPMEYLLTIDSAEFDGGTYERWLPESESHIWNASYEVRISVQCAAGLMLGDMGNINVFVCRGCSPWKHRWIFQCS